SRMTNELRELHSELAKQAETSKPGADAERIGPATLPPENLQSYSDEFKRREGTAQRAKVKNRQLANRGTEHETVPHRLGERPLIDGANASLGNSFPQPQITQLPLDTSRVEALLSLTASLPGPNARPGFILLPRNRGRITITLASPVNSIRFRLFYVS